MRLGDPRVIYVLSFQGAPAANVEELEAMPAIGKFLASYDPEAGAPGPVTGYATWTDDLREAMHFATFDAALECWRTRSVTVPDRLDGRPNRPLTTVTLAVDRYVVREVVG